MTMGSHIFQAALCGKTTDIAKDFISTLTGKSHLVFAADEAAEIQKRRIHIGHAGHILCIDCGKERLEERILITLEIGVGCLILLKHTIDIGQIPLRLEGVCLEIPVIVLKVEGKSVERFTTCVHIVCGDGGHDARIDAA